MNKTTGFLRLMRPANLVTAVADILAGVAISGFWTNNIFNSASLIQAGLLCLATIALYGGGVVFNDVFDAELDRVERPERPIPSGVISVREGLLGATALLLIGILLAAFINPVSLELAILIAVASVVYDKWGKHHTFIGPLNMGACRGLNLLLGMSIIPGMPGQWWFLAFVPVIYIASITMISRGEVHGSNKTTLYSGAFLYIIVILCLLWFAVRNGTLPTTLAFVLLFALMIFPPLYRAIQAPVGKNIGKAVKAGVLALILMNAAWAAAAGALYLALIILLLLPLSLGLAKMFAVT